MFSWIDRTESGVLKIFVVSSWIIFLVLARNFDGYVCEFLFFVMCWIWNIIKKSSHHLMPLKYWSFPFDGCMWNRKKKNMHSNECPFSYPNQASCLSFSVWQRLAYLLSRSCLSLVAWPLKQACLEVVSSEGDQGLVNSKTVSVTTSPSNLTPRWDNCSGHLSSTVLSVSYTHLTLPTSDLV